MTFPIRFHKLDDSEDFDPIFAKLQRRTERDLERIRKETQLLEQHERNAARAFHRDLMETMPDDPIVKAMTNNHPWLLEEEDPHAARACPACQERA